MVNLIDSVFDIYTYESSFTQREDLLAKLNDPAEIEWEDRIGGYKEAMRKSFEFNDFATLNRALQFSYVKEGKHFIQEKNMNFEWFNDNAFIKIEKDSEYNQKFTNAFTEHTINLIYVVSNDNLFGTIEFKNKNITINPKPGSLIILPSSTEYEYLVKTSGDNGFILGMCYIEK